MNVVRKERGTGNMKKKASQLLACIMLMAITLCGCEGGSITGGGNIKIFFSIIEGGDYYENWAAMVQSKAAEEGVQVDVEYADSSIEKQDGHIKKAVEEGYDAIICSLVSTDITGGLEDIAGKIPMVFVNSKPADSQLIPDKDVTIVSEDIMAGQYQAEYVLDKMPDKDELNVAILKGPKGRVSAEERTKGVKQVLAASGKKINYVFLDNADYNPDVAKEVYGQFLKTGVSVDCIICNNDNMALGAIAACEEANVSLDSTMVLGIDASEDGCQAIMNGKMDFSIFQDLEGQAAAAVTAAIRLAKGKSVKDMEGASEDCKYIWVPYGKVDSSNVAGHMGN